MALTQENRLIAIDSPLGPDVLLLRGFSGQEGISQLFSFELDLLSEDAEIKFEDIIGKRVTIRLVVGDDEERFFNGFISRFVQTGSDTGLANYRATMVPWLYTITGVSPSSGVSSTSTWTTSNSRPSTSRISRRRGDVEARNSPFDGDALIFQSR